MPKKFFKPPKDLIKEWPEVFSDIYINTMPVEYVENIQLEFNNGGVWEIDIQSQLSEYKVDEISDKIMFAFNEYHEEISKISFKLDINKLRHDIETSTKRLF